MKKATQKKHHSQQHTEASIQSNETSVFRKKLPSWAEIEGIHFPTRLSLEQCSGERTARYKGELVKRLFPGGGDRMIDLTGGLGVDFSFIAPNFNNAIYIERQHLLCEAAQNNFSKLGLANVTIIEGDGIEQLAEQAAANLIFIDPARRDQTGRKTVFIEDCEPDVLALLPKLWEKTACVILKLSPMLDLTRAMNSLKSVSEAHIVSDGGECKELLLVLSPQASSTRIYCVEGNQRVSFLPEEETTANATYTSIPKTYLYEPGSSLLKAGAFKWIAQHYHLEKLHVNSHLYTSDEYIEDFPGRHFIVKQVCGFSKKELRALCNTVDKANLTIRNFPGTVAELRKRLKLKEGGDAYWFATTLANEKHVIIDCRKASSNVEQESR